MLSTGKTSTIGVRNVKCGLYNPLYYGCSGHKMDVIRRVSVTSEPKA